MHEHGVGFKGLYTFPVIIKDNKIYVKIDKSKLSKYKEEEFIEKTTHLKDHFVVVGGGVAGISAIETLVKSGFGGKITLISNEDTLPYDWTILSKNINVKSEYILIKDESFFKKNNI